jgi:hypothetical protein
MVGVLMSVGVMTVGVMTVGVMSVGDITVGVMTTKIKDIDENVDELCFQCSCASMFT